MLLIDFHLSYLINSPTTKSGFFLCLQHALRFRFAVRNFRMPRFAGHEVSELRFHCKASFGMDGQEFMRRLNTCRIIISGENLTLFPSLRLGIEPRIPH
jgi:hypothetical protein